MRIPRTEADLLQLIRDKVEESVFLDYKRAEALSGKGDLTREVSKDVSSFANSAGGVLIYGIAEGGAESKHLPDAISPLDRNKFSKERLEHLIGNISQRSQILRSCPLLFRLIRNTSRTLWPFLPAPRLISARISAITGGTTSSPSRWKTMKSVM